MPALDSDFVRSEFPAFAEPSLQGFCHFENAGGSYACKPVIDRLEHFYRRTKVQPYYAFEPSRLAGEQMDQARQRWAAWLNVSADEVHFGPSTSQNTYVLAQALRQHLRPGDEIIVTNQDHEANVGAWRRLAEEGFTVHEWGVDVDTGELQTETLQTLLNDRTRVVAFTHCSNLLASINPVAEWVNLVHGAGAIALVDGVSYAPHALPDLRSLGADAYFFSLYKVYGPHLGLMFLRSELNQRLPNQGHYFNAGKPTARFTPAGPDHAQIASANGVIDYLEAFAAHHDCPVTRPRERANFVNECFRQHESTLLQPLLDFLDQHPRVSLLGRRRAAERAPTVAFTVAGMSSADLASRLAERRFGVGVGDFYARRLVERLGIDPADGAVRISFVHYTCDEDVARLAATIDQLLAAD